MYELRLLAMLVVGDANHFVEIANVQTADVAVVVHGVGIGVPRGKEHDLLHERYLQSNFRLLPAVRNIYKNAHRRRPVCVVPVMAIHLSYDIEPENKKVPSANMQMAL